MKPRKYTMESESNYLLAIFFTPVSIYHHVQSPPVVELQKAWQGLAEYDDLQLQSSREGVQ